MLKDYVDFSAVPASQYKIHDRLTNWAQWCHGRQGRCGDASPMFALYKSSDARREYGAETGGAVVDGMDAQRISKGVSVLPESHRHALNWYYVYRCDPQKAARALGTTLHGLERFVLDGRLMLINRKI